MHFASFLSLLVAPAALADLGSSPLPNAFGGIEVRAAKGFIRKKQSDPYCPETWMDEYLSAKGKKFTNFEVFKADDLQDGFVCEYAISPENKAMVILDVDRSSKAELDLCYRYLLIDNMKDKLGARTTRTIISADIVNKDLRKAIQAGMTAAGKNPNADSTAIFKPGSRGWLEFLTDNDIAAGMLNTLCESGKREMGNAKLKHFVAVSRKNAKKPTKPDLHVVAVLK